MFSMKIKHNILSKSINYIYINKISIHVFALWLIYIVLKFSFTGINFLNLQQPKLTLSKTCNEKKILTGAVKQFRFSFPINGWMHEDLTHALDTLSSKNTT